MSSVPPFEDFAGSCSFLGGIPVLLQIQLANTKARKRCWVTLKFNERLVKWTSLEFSVPENQSTNLRQSIWHVPWTQYESFLGSNSCGGLALEGSKAYSRFRTQVGQRNRGFFLWLKNDPKTHGYLKLQTSKLMDNQLEVPPQRWQNSVPPSPVRVPVELQPARCQVSPLFGERGNMKLMASNGSYGWWEKIRLTTGENIVSHGIFLFTAAGAGFCQQHVEIARRYPVLFR